MGGLATTGGGAVTGGGAGVTGAGVRAKGSDTVCGARAAVVVEAGGGPQTSAPHQCGSYESATGAAPPVMSGVGGVGPLAPIHPIDRAM